MENYTKLCEILKTNPSIVDNNGELLKNKIQELARKLDKSLLQTLLADNFTKDMFFKDVEGVQVFDANKFSYIVDSKSFLPSSYTAFSQNIFLTDGTGPISKNKEIVLSFPNKDCLLEFDSSDPDENRNEIFLNETLMKNEIDVLLEPKAFENTEKHELSQNGELIKIHATSFDTEKDNLVIKGNNLLALHSLYPKYKNQIKLMYWDILYNTENDKVPYSDTFKHGSWLTMMKNRLEIAKKLLRKDGVICLQCDDNEIHYLKVLCDEIFGRENFVNTIVNQSANSVFGTKAAHKDKTFIKVKDYILIYKMNELTINPLYTPSRSYLHDSHDFIYENGVKISTTKWFEKNYKKDFETSNININKKSIHEFLEKNDKLRKQIVEKLLDIQFRTGGTYSEEGLNENELSDLSKGLIVEHDGLLLYRENDGKGKTSFLRSLRSSCQFINGEYRKCDILGDVWNTSAGYGNINAEGDVKLLNGKKPEMLLKMILTALTNEGDIVLDAFLGSGTTAAVAHKMNRRYIGIEQLDKHYKMVCERLDNIILGDQTGISKEVNWDKGGSFIKVELAKNNLKLIEKINTCPSEELISIYREMKTSPFVLYRVDIDKLSENEENFLALNEKDQRHFLTSVIDKNNLYINYSEIDDAKFSLSDEDKTFAKEFYSEER